MRKENAKRIIRALLEEGITKEEILEMIGCRKTEIAKSIPKNLPKDEERIRKLLTEDLKIRMDLTGGKYIFDIMMIWNAGVILTMQETYELIVRPEEMISKTSFERNIAFAIQSLSEQHQKSIQKLNIREEQISAKYPSNKFFLKKLYYYVQKNA